MVLRGGGGISASNDVHQLLKDGWSKMDDNVTPTTRKNMSASMAEEIVMLDGEASSSRRLEEGAVETPIAVEYRVYKTRWFGLVQLVLLNTIVSWDVSVSL